MSEIRVCSVDDVKQGAAARFDVDGHRLCVVRLAGRDGRADDWYVSGD